MKIVRFFIYPTSNFQYYREAQQENFQKNLRPKTPHGIWQQCQLIQMKIQISKVGQNRHRVRQALQKQLSLLHSLKMYGNSFPNYY